MEFRILGPLELWDGDRLVWVGAPKQRTLLATFLLHANQVVSADRLIDCLWDDTPPPSARNTLQTLILRLRRTLGTEGDQRLVTRPPGYLLRVEPDELDLHRFESLVAAARRALAGDDAEHAAACLREALELWRGSALDDVASEWLRRTAGPRLEEARLNALEERIDADLRLGRHAALISELEGLVAEHPLRERLRGQLMLALFRSGRQGDALHVYRAGREASREELGLDPGPELQRLQQVILAGEPPPRRLLLCQLPPEVEDFTGRDDVVAQVRGWLELNPGTAVVIWAIAGMAGVGKTALAVHLAHQMRARYPDGQLWVNLGGTEACGLSAADALGQFLWALGVEGTALPQELEARARLYRARLADQRVLVILDNASSEVQVRPLLPGSPGCAALVTSRAPLAALEAARSVTLEVLEPEQAVQLLAKVVGPARVAAEREAAEAIARLCGGLPLAIRIAGARLASRHHWPLARFAERLADERRRLDELRVGDLEVRAGFAVSYHAQAHSEQRAFRLLGLLDAPDFAAWTAAALLGCDLRDAEEALDRLVDAQLLEASGQDRYRFHDLLHIFAQERLRAEEPATEQRAALTRAVGACLTLARRADALLEPGNHRQVRLDARAGRGWRPADAVVRAVCQDPAGWCAAEWTVLVAAVEQAHAAGRWQLTWQLAACLVAFANLRGHWDVWRRTHELALDAAQRVRSRPGEALILCSLGEVEWELGRFDAAQMRYGEALAAFQELGDRHGVACVRRCIGDARWAQGRLKEAIADYDQCLPILREFGDGRGVADTLHSLGTVYRDQGRFEDARGCLEESLALFDALGDRRWAAYALRNLGIVCRDQGRYGDARAYLERCLPVFGEAGDRLGEALALQSLGMVHRVTNRYQEAHACYARCLTQFRELGDRHGEASALRSIGDLHLDEGQPQDAIGCYARCLPVFRELGDRRGEADTLHGLGSAYLDQSRLEEAVAVYGETLAVVRERGYRLREGRTLGRLGMVLTRAGDPTGARAAWREALGIFYELGAPDAAQVEGWLANEQPLGG